MAKMKAIVTGELESLEMDLHTAEDAAAVEELTNKAQARVYGAEKSGTFSTEEAAAWREAVVKAATGRLAELEYLSK